MSDDHMERFAALVLPEEFVRLLKNPAPAGESPVPRLLQGSPGLRLVLERAFGEFHGPRLGLEKVFNSLGWAHFRDRLASVYLFKAQNDVFPDKTDMDLLDAIHALETRFADKVVTGCSRLFLLGFYLRLLGTVREGAVPEVPDGVQRALALTQVRSDRPDWLVLLCWHFDAFLGTETFLGTLRAGFSYRDIFQRLTEEQRRLMLDNMLAYGASIREADPFTFERI